MKTTLIAAALSAALVAGCATPTRQSGGGYQSIYIPVIDRAGSSATPDVYARDIDECNRLAQQRPAGSAAADGALGGLLVGALLGAVVGSAYHDTGYGAAYGAALGTTTGAVQGAAQGVAGQQRIVRECLRGRGHRVVE